MVEATIFRCSLSGDRRDKQKWRSVRLNIIVRLNIGFLSNKL